ncbi:MAG: uracil-DNA glycosylase family protein, partial [Ostreibacterium sp.]
QAIQMALAQLSDEEKESQSIFHTLVSGVGSAAAEWMIITPPPGQRHLKNAQLMDDDESQLLAEMMVSIGKTQENIYITPLLKQGVYKQKDPDETILAKHLPILAAEIAWIKPKRLLLMGRIPNQVLLSTKALLSALMHKNYYLQQGQLIVPVTSLPSLNYFLAMPAEKKILWQQLKVLC